MTANALVEQFRNNGFAVARRHVDPDLLSALEDEARELICWFADGYRSDDFWCYEEPGRPLPILYRIHNLEKQGMPRIRELFSGGVLEGLASRFLGRLGRSTVCAMVVKTNGGAGVPWHRDRADVPQGTALNLSVYLDPSDASNGCFEAVPGSHRLPDDADVELARQRGPRVLVSANPGDVVIHDVRLVHGSGDNTGGVERRSIITEFAVVASGGSA